MEGNLIYSKLIDLRVDHPKRLHRNTQNNVWSNTWAPHGPTKWDHHKDRSLATKTLERKRWKVVECSPGAPYPSCACCLSPAVSSESKSLMFAYKCSEGICSSYCFLCRLSTDPPVFCPSCSSTFQRYLVLQISEPFWEFSSMNLLFLRLFPIAALGFVFSVLLCWLLFVHLHSRFQNLFEISHLLLSHLWFTLNLCLCLLRSFTF